MKKQYAVLRNKQQIGLFTLKEIGRIELFSTDLIWVQGKSIAWQTPDKIDELKKYVKPAPPALEPEVTVVQEKPTITQTEFTSKASVTWDSDNRDKDTGMFTYFKPVAHSAPGSEQTKVTQNTEAELRAGHNNEESKPSVTTPVAKEELSVNQVEVVNETEATKTTLNADDNVSKSHTKSPVQQAEFLVNPEVIHETKVEAEEISLTHDYATSDPPIESPKTQAELAVEPEIIQKTEAIETPLNQDNNAGVSPVEPPIAQAEHAVEPEVIPEAKAVETPLNEDNNADVSPVEPPIAQAEPVVEPEIIHKAEAIETPLNEDNNADVSPVESPIAQAELAVEPEIIHKTEAIETPLNQDNNADVSPVESPIAQAEHAVEPEVIHKAEAIETSLNKDNNAGVSPVESPIAQAEPVVEPEVIPEAEAVETIVSQNVDEEAVSLEAVYIVKPQIEIPSKNGAPEVSVNQNYDIDKPTTSAYVVKPKPAFNLMKVAPEIEVLETAVNQNDAANKSPITAYVVKPQPVFNQMEVAQKSGVIKTANDTIENLAAVYVHAPKGTEVTHDIKKIEKTFKPNDETETLNLNRHVYVRFPVRVPK